MPAHDIDLNYALADRFEATSGRAYLTGWDTLLRLPMMQRERDTRAGLSTAGFVSGYPGSHEINLAIEKGEVQGGCGETWSSVAATYPHWFRDNTVKVLVQEDIDGYPELNKAGVPRVRDFAKTYEQRQILDLVFSQTTFGRPYVVAPEVPAERVAALRAAFMATMRNPDLVAEAGKMKLDVLPVPGEELQTKIAKIFATPRELVEKARQAMVAK